MVLRCGLASGPRVSLEASERNASLGEYGVWLLKLKESWKDFEDNGRARTDRTTTGTVVSRCRVRTV
ncbi:hypothetical protein VUR80DRAFT_822 [Thermomyces stellatus]